MKRQAVSAFALVLLRSAAAFSAVPMEKPPIVIAGAGLHGAALAYYLTKRGEKPLLIEKHSVAAAASGKGGGFLARDWGDGGPTEALHRVSFALHAELARELNVESYRTLPVVSVTPGARSKRTKDLVPWLDGEIAQASWMDRDGGAQVAPHELCSKLVEAAVAAGAQLLIGSVEGVEKNEGRVSGVVVAGAHGRETVACSAFACTMGPWATRASEWFGLPIPMTGIRSTSIVFKAEPGASVEPFALFCGEDDRFGTHLEVYPRNSGEVYLCGLGGSEHVTGERLCAGEFPPGEVHADPARVAAAARAFSQMSHRLGRPEPDASQACMRPCPPDAMPYMGAVPGLANAYVSAGHNCWGILWAPVSGKAMSELILDGRASCVDLAPFDVGRFAQRASGGRGRKQRSDDVGEQW
jgi:glycine/D-amino acid oxidase-like deaminating enzyme